MADNDQDLSLKNARWFARELGHFTPKEQSVLLETKDFGQFEKILFDKGVLNSVGLWQGRIDWQNHTSQGVKIPIAADNTQPSKTQPGVVGLAGTQPLASPPAKTAWTPFPQNTLQGVGAPNTLRGAQAPASAPKTSGFRSRLSYFGPRSIARRIRGKIMGTRIGKRIAGSRLGRLAGKANRFRNRTSRVTRRIKNMFSPIAYLQNLLLRAGLGAIASAIGGFVSSVITVITSTIVAVGSFAVGAAAFILAKISAAAGVALAAVNLPWAVVIALVIFIFVALFGILFGDPSARGGTPPASPYPGITFSKIGPDRVPNGQNITYTISFFHNADEAGACTLDNITLVDDIPPRTTLVQDPTLTTGLYTYSNGRVLWKLSDPQNDTNPPTQTSKGFAFKLTISPENDITITNKIYIEGCN